VPSKRYEGWTSWSLAPRSCCVDQWRSVRSCQRSSCVSCDARIANLLSGTRGLRTRRYRSIVCNVCAGSGVYTVRYRLFREDCGHRGARAARGGPSTGPLRGSGHCRSMKPLNWEGERNRMSRRLSFELRGWIGPTGQLADASVASGIEAARSIVRTSWMR